MPKDYRYFNNRLLKKENKWEVKKAKEQFTPVQIDLPITPLGCLLLLAVMNTSASAQHQRHYTGFRSPSDNGALLLHYGNCSVSSSPSPLSIGHTSSAPQSFLHAQIPDPKLKSVSSTSTEIKKEKRPTPYAPFFVDVPHDEIPIKISNELKHSIDESKKTRNIFILRKAELLEKKLKNFQTFVRDALSSLPINSPVMKRIKETNLKIIILHEDLPGQGNHLKRAYYDTELNQIGIYLHETTLDDLKRTLLNEFHHAGVVTKNFIRLQRKVSEQRQMTSYVNENGDINEEKKAQLVQAHTEFKTNVDRFIGIHQKTVENKALTLEEKSFFDSVAKAIQEVHLFRVFPIKFDQNDFLYVKRRGFILHTYSDYSLRVSKNISPGTKYEMHLYPHYEGQNIMSANFNYVFPGNPASKIISFIHEMEHLSRIETAYAAQSEDQRVNEYSSSIEELVPSLKQLLAPKWCQYFSEFHEINDYCSGPSLSR